MEKENSDKTIPVSVLLNKGRGTMKNRTAVIGIEYTKHAHKRSGQRAIGTDAVSAAITYGAVYKIGRHDRAYWLNRESLDLCGFDGRGICRYEGVAVLTMEDGRVKTLMHCWRKPHHWEKIA